MPVTMFDLIKACSLRTEYRRIRSNVHRKIKCSMVLVTASDGHKKEGSRQTKAKNWEEYFMENQRKRTRAKRLLAGILAAAIILTGMNLNQFVFAEGATTTQYITLFFVDNTAEQWVKNDNAVMEAVDNSRGHDSYWMTQVDETTWSVRVPESAYNITFNRYNPDKTTQWNSWSAGGRDENNAYYADGSEYGHWEYLEDNEMYFHEGDIIYLDVSEFTEWEKDNALMYVNFTEASKEENGGNNVVISSADVTKYAPQKVENRIEEYVYRYMVTQEDEGATRLRFWRGNDTMLWNCSAVLSYEDYVAGLDCVKVTGWNDTGSSYEYEYNMDEEKDTDGDGVPDYLEIIWGMDHKSDDSDGDGLTDYEECYITLTDPLNADTDENGITDGEDDLDGDGISNAEEIRLGTDPTKGDTDGDNLTDYEEVYTYGTDPLNTDTDGDGLSDYDDVILGFSPLLQDTDGNGIIDSEEKIYQSVSEQIECEEAPVVTEVSVSLNTSGNVENLVKIENMYGKDEQSSDVVGLVGVPVDITCEAEFETAEITFSYDPESLGETEEDNLSIMWYDEENDWYQILDEDSVIDKENHTVSYTTTHFSTYMLVNKQEWYEAWRENIDYRNSGEGDTSKNYFDIAFVVDTSGSMLGTRIMSALVAMRNFTEALETKDSAAIISFNSSAKLVEDFTNDKSILKQRLTTLVASGGTNVNNGLLKAIAAFDNYDSQNKKIIVLICDGDVNYVQSTINKCVDRGIQIYAINVANASSHTSLEKMASLTGGQYYYGSSASQIETMFASVRGDTLEQIDPTDTDGDGLYDIYEKAGMKLSNGKVIFTSASMKDTDGDGLSDFQETGIIYNVDNRYIGNGQSTTVSYFKMRSNPTMKDTDRDGIMDDVDVKPWKSDMVVVAELDNKYTASSYLKIRGQNGTIYDGGNQGWWEDKTSEEKTGNDVIDYFSFAWDKYYRLEHFGCGVIAMSDAELYMTLQNSNYNLSYGTLQTIDAGTYDISDYRDYIEEMYDNKYTIGSGIDDRVIGLKPWVMESGFFKFLKANGNEHNFVIWAVDSSFGKSVQEEYVQKRIEMMLDDNIPVVFAYCDLREKEISMYSDWRDVYNKSAKGPTSHYMTITGLLEVLDQNTMEYKKVLKVVSWGKVYYIDYEEYADKLSYFSNILSVY